MKILIVRLSALGDVVHALPALAAIRARQPDAEVDWLVEEAYASILSLADGLRRRIIVRARITNESNGTVMFGGGRGYLRAVRYLRRQRYDVALDLQGLIKSALWARLSGARRVVGFGREQLREPAAATMYSETVTPPEGVHVIEKNMSVVAAVLGSPPQESPRFPLRIIAAPDIAHAIAAAGGARRYVVINPGQGGPTEVAARTIWRACRRHQGAVGADVAGDVGDRPSTRWPTPWRPPLPGPRRRRRSPPSAIWRR